MTIRAKTEAVAARLIVDLKPMNRRAEYESLLRTALEAGYDVIGLEEFQSRVTRGEHDKPMLAIRHDVDIGNVAGDEMFFVVERLLGVSASYYFRLATARTHARFIERLHKAGFEVGYHFEEAATLAKRERLRTRDVVFARREEIASNFLTNCARIRSTWCPALRSVSSHGDWINRRLGFTNEELIDDAVLSQANLTFEAYDPRLLEATDAYVSDAAVPPLRWTDGYDLSTALAEQKKPIYLLVHERQWHTAPVVNSLANLHRVWETMRYAIPASSR